MGRLSILVNSRPIDEYYDAQGEKYVEGRRGKPYVIRYENQSNEREKIVVSVDGLNVMTGDATWDKAYVVEPHGKIDIPGWRKNSGECAAFEFSSVKGSYNNHNENADINNVGVIGCKVYKEKKVLKWPEKKEVHHYHYDYHWPRHYWNGWPPSYYNITYTPDLNTYGGVGSSMGSVSMTASGMTHNAAEQKTFTAQNCASPGILRSANFVDPNQNFVGLLDVEPQSLGTAWGDSVEFKTETVHYDFETIPCQTIVMYYDERRGLERRGVDLRQPIYRERPKPQAFPDGCPSPGRPRT